MMLPRLLCCYTAVAACFVISTNPAHLLLLLLLLLPPLAGHDALRAAADAGAAEGAAGPAA
jgi:hypothetical protein